MKKKTKADAPVPLIDMLVGYFTVTTPTQDRIQLSNSPLVNDDQVRFALGTDPGSALPTPLLEDTFYFVIGARNNDFQVSVTQGGAALDITDTGTGATNEVWKKGLPDPGPVLETWQMSSTHVGSHTWDEYRKLKLTI
jgi:hypothetical protein